MNNPFQRIIRTPEFTPWVRLTMALVLLLGGMPPTMAADANQAERIILSPDSSEGSKALSQRNYYRGRAQKIPCLIWKAKRPKACILAIHGFGLHKATYSKFAKQMNRVGISVYAIDVRGFGDWVKKGANQIDFNGTLYDIGLALQEIKKRNPGKPIVVLGESMGGAIAMTAAAKYPNMVTGLISSVPAGDRFDKADSSIDVVKQFLFKGANVPMDVGPQIVGSATKKSGLRQLWLSDPLCRTRVTPNELIRFNNFMKRTLKVATKIDKMPVLFIQGSKDKLVRPAGTMKLFNRISSPHKQFVLSTTSEHLIFEYAQFNRKDLNFVANWIDGTIVDIIPNKIARPPRKKRTPRKKKRDDNALLAHTPRTGPSLKDMKKKRKRSSLSYWIELKRNGKIYRCNNKMTFKSGDAIRFHLIPETDGYAYIVLKQGTTGNSAVLFPSKTTGSNNLLRRGQDFPLPYQDWLAFDSNPGLEKVRIMFSQMPINNIASLITKKKVAYVSPDSSGAKDLVGTGLQLSWDDPTPVIMPDEITSSTAVAQGGNNSQVKLVFDNKGGTFAVDVALLHK